MRLATAEDLDRRAEPLLNRAAALRGRAEALAGSRRRAWASLAAAEHRAQALLLERRAEALLLLKVNLRERQARVQARAEMMVAGYQPPGRIPPGERELARRQGRERPEERR